MQAVEAAHSCEEDIRGTGEEHNPGPEEEVEHLLPQQMAGIHIEADRPDQPGQEVDHGRRTTLAAVDRSGLDYRRLPWEPVHRGHTGQMRAQKPLVRIQDGRGIAG